MGWPLVLGAYSSGWWMLTPSNLPSLIVSWVVCRRVWRLMEGEEEDVLDVLLEEEEEAAAAANFAGTTGSRPWCESDVAGVLATHYSDLSNRYGKDVTKEKVANLSGCWVTTNNRGTYGTPAVLLSIVGTHINGPGMLLVHRKR